MSGLLVLSIAVACRIRNPREQSSVPLLKLQAIQHSHVPRRRERQLLHSSWNRRSAISPAPPLSGRSWLHPDRVRSARHAPSNRLHGHENDHATTSEPYRVSWRPHLQHFSSRCPSDGVCNDRVCERLFGPSCCRLSFMERSRPLQYTSMNTLVFADIAEKDASSASSIASTAQQMSDQLRRSGGGASHSVFRSQHALRSDRNDLWNP